MTIFKPFVGGTESYALNDLTLENDLDVVNIYGNLQLYKDKQGLESARLLQQFFTDMVNELEHAEQNGTLPEKVEFKPTETVENPFA